MWLPKTPETISGILQNQNYLQAKCQWLTPIILATQEAERRRIMIRSQPGQIVLQDPIWKKLFKKRVVEWLKVKSLSSSPSTPSKTLFT
jgi:hypothetical protein